MKKISAFMDPKVAIMFSQELASGSYPEPNDPGLHHLTIHPL
jgi:hypothetical protein